MPFSTPHSHTAPLPSWHDSWPAYTGALLCTALVYGLWYVGVWPGPIGEDGYSLVANILQGEPAWTFKEATWLLYALATFGTTHQVEAAIIPLLLVHVLVLSRMLGFAYASGHKISAAVMFVLIVCAPHALNYASSLYADSVFSVAFIGICFEVWLALRRQRISGATLAFIGALLPMAALFKSNGIIILAPVLYLAWRGRGAGRYGLLFFVVFWLCVSHVGGKALQLGKGHGALKPLVLFETVNFMQTKPMNLWDNRHMVTEKTREIIYRYTSQQDLDTYYDRDYWDTLWHQNQDRIQFRQITHPEFRQLRREFFTYNLWRNIPAFTASRVNIFLATALAQGGIVGPADARDNRAMPLTQSTYNAWGADALVAVVDEAFEFSRDLRFLLWTPFVGIALLLVCTRRALRQREHASLIVCATLLVQLGGIFVFSIAAEYRYLLMFFYAPLLLVPMLFALPREKEWLKY